MVILTLLIKGLKYSGKLLQYLCLSPWANVRKLFIRVTYCHSMVCTAILVFYNTGWQQYHGMAVNYHGKKFNNINPSCQFHKTFLDVIYTPSSITCGNTLIVPLFSPKKFYEISHKLCDFSLMGYFCKLIMTFENLK